MKNRKALIGIATGTMIAVCAGSASAATVTAKYTYQYAQSTNVTSGQPISGNVTTVKFNWTRQDSPGPGVDSMVPSAFTSYCVDMGQYVSANTNYTFDVWTPEQAGYSADQALWLKRLWGEYSDDISGDTTSGAFQLAVWEIVFDSGGSLSTGSFVVNSPNNVKTTAQGWLDSVRSLSYSGAVAGDIAVLHSATQQDQVVMLNTPIPAPGAGAVATLGLGLAFMRRKRS